MNAEIAQIVIPALLVAIIAIAFFAFFRKKVNAKIDALGLSVVFNGENVSIPSPDASTSGTAPPGSSDAPPNGGNGNHVMNNLGVVGFGETIIHNVTIVNPSSPGGPPDPK